MITDYFDIYKHKVRFDAIKKQIDERQKKVDYNKGATVSGGIMARIINEHCDKVQQELDRRREVLEAEKSKFGIEILAVEDVQKNIDDNFVQAMLTVLQKSGLNAATTNKRGINVLKNVNYITNLFYLYPEEKVEQYISQFIDELYVLDSGEQIELIKNRKTKQIKNLFQDALNDMYAESLNFVSVDYFNDPKRQVLDGQLSINSIPAGDNF